MSSYNNNETAESKYLTLTDIYLYQCYASRHSSSLKEAQEDAIFLLYYLYCDVAAMLRTHTAFHTPETHCRRRVSKLVTLWNSSMYDGNFTLQIVS